MGQASYKGYSFLEKIGFAALIVAWVLFGVNYLGDMLVKSTPLEKSATVIASDKLKPAAKKAETSEPIVDNALELMASADLARGVKLFKKCASCHKVTANALRSVGPSLWAVVGRSKASQKPFKYSEALKSAGGDWNFADLNSFLASPKNFAPGTKMSFRGFKKPEDRAAVMLYLRSLSDQPVPLP